MSEFPVIRTFIHFNAPLPSSRSASAPPGTCLRSGDSGVRVPKRRKLKKSVSSPADEDEGVLQEYRSTAIVETWMRLADMLCDQRIRNALSQSSLVLRLRGYLPRYLFRDWAFYNFVHKDHTTILTELCRIGFIHENKDANQFEFWSADCLYLDHRNAFLRTLVAEAENLLEAKKKGFFSVLVNGDIVVCILCCTELMLKDVIAQTRAVLNLGRKKAVAKHRNRTLHSGKLSDQGIGAGSFFTLDFF